MSLQTTLTVEKALGISIAILEQEAMLTLTYVSLKAYSICRISQLQWLDCTYTNSSYLITSVYASGLLDNAIDLS